MSKARPRTDPRGWRGQAPPALDTRLFLSDQGEWYMELIDSLTEQPSEVVAHIATGAVEAWNPEQYRYDPQAKLCGCWEWAYRCGHCLQGVQHDDLATSIGWLADWLRLRYQALADVPQPSNPTAPTSASPTTLIERYAEPDVDYRRRRGLTKVGLVPSADTVMVGDRVYAVEIDAYGTVVELPSVEGGSVTLMFQPGTPRPYAPPGIFAFDYGEFVFA